MRIQKLWVTPNNPFDFINWIKENHRKSVLLIRGPEIVDLLVKKLGLVKVPTFEKDEIYFRSTDLKITLSFTIVIGTSDRMYYLLSFFQNQEAGQLYMQPETLKNLKNFYLARYPKSNLIFDFPHNH